MKHHRDPEILIIDDSRSICLYVAQILADAGYRVGMANDGEEGLAAVRASAPDVILLDIEMPGMNGLEVLEALSKEEHLFSIILFTTRSQARSRIEGLNSGADDYICKPFEEEDLLARVNAAVRTARLKKDLSHAVRNASQALQKLHEVQGQMIEEQKLFALGELAAGVAHQINNPLAFVHSNLGTLKRYNETLLELMEMMVAWGSSGNETSAEVLLRLLNSAKTARIRKDLMPLLQETEEGVQRITNIVKCLSVLDLAGSMIKNTGIDLNDVVGSCVTTLKSRLLPGICINWLPQQVPTVISGDRTLISAAVEYVLANAIEAVGKAGTISVILASDKKNASIEVADSGSGIPVANVSKIFEPFFTTKLSSDHVGMGLTVARSFVKAHGGKIEVASHSNSGSKVIIALPLEKMGEGYESFNGK